MGCRDAMLRFLLGRWFNDLCIGYIWSVDVICICVCCGGGYYLMTRLGICGGVRAEGINEGINGEGINGVVERISRIQFFL